MLESRKQAARNSNASQPPAPRSSLFPAPRFTHTHTHTHAFTHTRTHARTHTHTHARTHARTPPKQGLTQPTLLSAAYPPDSRSPPARPWRPFLTLPTPPVSRSPPTPHPPPHSKAALGGTPGAGGRRVRAPRAFSDAANPPASTSLRTPPPHHHLSLTIL